MTNDYLAQMTNGLPLGNVSATPSCLNCQGVLPSGRSRSYRSDACRITAWKRRKRATASTAEIPKDRPSKATSIYECPLCEVRYLGKQYCGDCGCFCRKVGSGGLCPHCDEPVAFADLIETGTL